jgi:AraC-like DNA-binding protein
LRNLFVQREKLRIKYSNHPSEEEPTPTPGLDELFLKNARAILEKNYADEAFGIEELYNALGISRVQLHRKLNALTGQSASHFIRSFRLEKSREMLLTTTKSVSEIAYETGFSDANYFSRVFAQEYGVPPSDVRKVTARTAA